MMQTETRPSRWIIRPITLTKPRLRLFCLPFAGAGASTYVRWRNGLANFGIELCAVQLPGREYRLEEPFETDLVESANKLAHEISGFFGFPFALFGHSMGSAIAFETARILRNTFGVEPAHLIVTGRNAPHVAEPTGLSRICSDAAFLDQISVRYGEVPPAILEDDDFRILYISILRADIAMLDKYKYNGSAPISCPISAFYGTSDFRTSPSGMNSWRELTTGAFQVASMPGGHFFINTNTENLIYEIFTCCLGNLSAP